MVYFKLKEVNKLEITYNNYDFEHGDKGKEKFIKKIQRLFRSSPEYKRWVWLQHETKELVCPFTKINGNLSPDLIELHHHPFTLYEIIEIFLDNIVERYGATYEGVHVLNCVSTFDVQRVIQDVHLLDYVPFVPLSKTYHQQYHQLNSDVWFEQTLEIKEEWIINREKIDKMIEFLKKQEVTIFKFN